jgi:hypothetical protein
MHCTSITNQKFAYAGAAATITFWPDIKQSQLQVPHKTHCGQSVKYALRAMRKKAYSAEYAFWPKTHCAQSAQNNKNRT